MTDTSNAPAVDAVVSAGSAMANVLYNLCQTDTLTPRDRQVMKEAQTEWDRVRSLAAQAARAPGAVMVDRIASVSDEMVAEGLKLYSEGGCNGLDEYERREVVRNILEAALSAAPPVAREDLLEKRPYAFTVTRVDGSIDLILREERAQEMCELIEGARYDGLYLRAGVADELHQRVATPAPSQQPEGEAGGLVERLRYAFWPAAEEAAAKIEADAARIAELEAENAGLKEQLSHGSFYREEDIDRLEDRASVAEARATKAEADTYQDAADIAAEYVLRIGSYGCEVLADGIREAIAEKSTARAALGRG